MNTENHHTKLFIRYGQAILLVSLLALIPMFTIPADPKNAVLFGFSARRLLIVSLFLLVALGAEVALWGLRKDRPWATDIVLKVQAFFSSSLRYAIWMFCGGGSLMILLFILRQLLNLRFNSPASEIIRRFLPPLLWLSAMILFTLCLAAVVGQTHNKKMLGCLFQLPCLARFRQRWQGRKQLNLRQEDWPWLFFLALAVGGYILLALIFAFHWNGIVEREEAVIYVLGWILAPLGSIVSVPKLIWLFEKPLGKVLGAPSILVFLNTLLLTCLITGLNLIGRIEQPGLPVSVLSFGFILVIPLVNLIAIKKLQTTKNIGPVSVWATLIVGIIGLVNFIGIFPYFDGKYSTPIYMLAIAFLVGIAALRINRPKVLFIRNQFLLWGVDFLVIVLIILVCFDPAFAIDKVHQNFYMGPANRLLHNGTMLVDTFSQYGVLVIYFLSSLVTSGVMPFTYQGLSVGIAVLTIVHFSLIYLLLIALVRDRFYAILLLVLTMLLGLFSTLGVFQAYPSIGPLRFGLAYLVLIVVFLRLRFPRLHRASLVLEYSLIGIASLWSFETFVYTAFAYMGICMFESVKYQVRFRSILRNFINRLIWMLVTLAIFQGIFSLWTYLQSGAWPEWGIYFDFIKRYSVLEFGTILIEPWSPWIFPIAIYFASLMVFSYRFLYMKDLVYSPENEFVFGLTFLGIASYTYFLGRSHPNNLYHIQMPAVIVAGYWFVRIFSQSQLVSIEFRKATKFAFFSAATLLILTTFPSFVAKTQQNHTGLSMVYNSLHSVVDGRGLSLDRQRAALIESFAGENPPQSVTDASELLREFTPGQENAAVLIPPQFIVETLILADRTHRFPISDPNEDTLSDRLAERIIAFPHGLGVGDVIVIGNDPHAYNSSRESMLVIKLINRMCSEFSLIEIEQATSGVAAVRLAEFDEMPTDFCVSMQRLETQ